MGIARVDGYLVVRMLSQWKERRVPKKYLSSSIKVSRDAFKS